MSRWCARLLVRVADPRFGCGESRPTSSTSAASGDNQPASVVCESRPDVPFGTELTLQAFVLDSASYFGASATNGLRIRIE